MPELTNRSDLNDGTHPGVFEERTPRAARPHLEPERSVPSHTHPEPDVVPHSLSGRLELGDATYDIGPGDLARFGGEGEVSPHALEDPKAILVFAPAVA